MTKLALVWSAERAGREIDAIWEKRQAVERKRADYDDTLRAKLIEAKANYEGPFKEFVEKHTHISLTTAIPCCARHALMPPAARIRSCSAPHAAFSALLY